jgi:FtsP/CotA-like multicopper oxidase with cupredoxin domain
MSKRLHLSRRGFLKLGGGLVAATAGVRLLPAWKGRVLSSLTAADAAGLASPAPTIFKHLIGSDGWISLPGNVSENGVVVAPDPLGPLTANPGNPGLGEQFTTYVFGFRDVTGLSSQQVLNQKNKVQNSAPLLVFDEGDSIQITLTNLGLALRPDLTDPHTIHWHGFRNATPIFDGVPEMSISVPIGRDFPYYYHPTDPGTYMYHCHNEDVEHVQMGMTGIVFVRPAQNKTGNGAGAPIARYNGGAASAPLGYAYNDGVALGDPRSTAYDREFGIFLNEMWALSHWNDAHIQESDWSDFHADFYLMNGRCYPDTLAPNGHWVDSGNPTGTGANGDLIPVVGYERLQYQPISSLIRCNAGDKVLLRFVNLGYTQPAMKLTGIQMHVIGKDATPMRGLPFDANGRRMGADTSYYTDTIYIGAGEAFDAIFTAPTFSGGTGSSGLGYDTYLLFNNALGTLTKPGGTGLGGQMTEVRVYAAGALARQTKPNT